MSWRTHKKTIAVFAGIVLTIWLIVLGLTIAVFFCGKDTSSAKWGQFGDAFGVANALFSGLALLGVIASLLMQGQDIDLQMQEMRESVAAQKAAAKMQEKQARVVALAEMLRATGSMVDYLNQNESRGTTHSPKGENVPTLTELYQQEIPRLVEQLKAELNGLVGEQGERAP